jgi:hypothetical protein
LTRDVAHRYVDAWTHGDRDRVSEVLSPDASVEWNLGLPADVATLLDTLTEIARVADSVQIIAETYADERAAVIYDCVAPDGTVRAAEFLAVVDGRIREVRQTYDVTALRRMLPDLLD